MRNEQVGKYIKLLCMQHQQGHLREEDMLEMCGSYDERIFSKFVKDEQGLYYNERMEQEAEKRKKYSESRSNNRKKKKTKDMIDDMSNTSQTYLADMENENEIVNEEDNKGVKEVRKKSKKTFTPPTFEEVLAYAIEKNREDLAKPFFDYFEAGEWVDSKGNKVRSWKQKFLTWANNTPVGARGANCQSNKAKNKSFFELLQEGAFDE